MHMRVCTHQKSIGTFQNTTAITPTAAATAAVAAATTTKHTVDTKQISRQMPWNSFSCEAKMNEQQK